MSDARVRRFHRTWITALAVFLGALVLFLSAPVSHAGGDSLWVIHTSVSILTSGNLDLNEFEELIFGYSDSPPHLMNIDGSLLDLFPWGASVVAIPFVLVVAAVTNVSGGSFGATINSTIPLFDIERQVAGLIAATTTVVIFAMFKLRTGSLRWSVAGAFIFATGTSAMSTTSRNMWIQGPGFLVASIVVVLCWYLWSEHGPAQERRWSTVAAWALGPLVVLAYATRPTLALLGLVSLVVVLRAGRRPFVGFAVATAVSAAAMIAVNLSTYGEVQPPYNQSRLNLTGSFPEALTANMFSPGRGLLVWSPVVAIALGSYAVRCWHRPLSGDLRDRLGEHGLDHMMVAWFVAHWFAISMFPHWWAGATVGPRLMFDVVPGVLLLLAATFKDLSGANLRRGAPLVLVTAVVATSLWASFVHVRAAHRMSVILWNWPSETRTNIELDPSRVWNWSDPQFLARPAPSLDPTERQAVSGSVASGSVASGSVASGSVASGAQRDASSSLRR